MTNLARNLCLSKALLDNVSETLTGRQVYEKYFETFTLADPDSNLSCLKSRPGLTTKIVNTMYKVRQPLEEPVFFSLKSFGDLSRLSNLLGREIVLYESTTAKHFRESPQATTILHDFRLLSSLAATEPLVFLVASKSRQLFRLPQAELAVDVGYLSDKAVSLAPADNEDWTRALSRLTGLQPCLSLPLRNIPADLQDRRSELYELWKEPILFVALCSSKLRAPTNRKLRRPSDSHFVTLALVGPPLAQLSHLQLERIDKVVCVVGGGRLTKKLCLLNAPFKQHVLSQLVRTAHKDKLCSRDLLSLPTVSRESARAAYLKQKKPKHVTRAELKGPKCVCEICSEKSYNNNMSKVGPEKLLTYNLDVTELLQLLGLASPENVLAVEKLCHLSVASMDIESTTLPLHLQKPVDPRTGVQHAVLDGFTLEGHLQKIQKPLMIAHLDGLMADEGESEPRVFVVESDSEEAVYDMMKTYWKFVKERHVLCTERKRLLVEPILRVLDAYRDKHAEVLLHHSPAGLDENDKLDVVGTWKQSVPGKLEHALKKLVHNYAIFSFYG